MATEADVITVLKEIPDPEIGVSLWDLGLIYGITFKDKGIVEVRVTLTSIGCPLFNLISEPIKTKVGALDGVKGVEVELTFEPPWTPDKMSEDAKLQLGFV